MKRRKVNLLLFVMLFWTLLANGCSMNTNTAEKTANVKSTDENKDNGKVDIEKTFKVLDDNNQTVEKSIKKSEEKPLTTKTDSGSKSDTGKQTDNRGPSACNHKWVAITKNVHHEVVYRTEPVYTTVTDYIDEPVYELRTMCRCGADITADVIGHYDDGCNLSYGNKPVHVGTNRIAVGTHQEQTGTKNVLVREAYDETVTTGYKCSVCGKTK